MPDRHEVGLVQGDNCTHVAVPSLGGTVALCNRLPIVRRLPGSFDPADPLACADCVQRIEGPA